MASSFDVQEAGLAVFRLRFTGRGYLRMPCAASQFPVPR